MKAFYVLCAVSSIASYCAALELNNNGYEDLYIVIQDPIKENHQLIDRIKVSHGWSKGKEINPTKTHRFLSEGIFTSLLFYFLK